MLVDYSFYTDIYKGNQIEENEFDKYIRKASNVISRYTFDRVKENTINKFPIELIENIKMCICELAEFEKSVYNINSISNGSNNNALDNSLFIKEKRAGAVSISMDTSVTSNILKQYTSTSSKSEKYKSILNDYLYPQKINGLYYNLLSWVKDEVCTDVFQNYYFV